MANGNGNGNGTTAWMWIVRFLMFLLPFMLMLVGYYVHTENAAAINASEARIRTTYLSNNDFDKWVKWQYQPDRKQIQQSLSRIEQAVEKHSEDTE